MKRLVEQTSGLVVLGLMLAISPAAADSRVNIGINIGVPPPPPIVIATPPQLVIVPGSPVFYAPAVDVTFFSYEGRYYTHHGGNWYVSRHYRGPWSYVVVERVPRPVLGVPVAYYKVPPGHAKKVSPGGGQPSHGKKGPKQKD